MEFFFRVIRVGTHIKLSTECGSFWSFFSPLFLAQHNSNFLKQKNKQTKTQTNKQNSQILAPNTSQSFLFKCVAASHRLQAATLCCTLRKHVMCCWLWGMLLNTNLASLHLFMQIQKPGINI